MLRLSRDHSRPPSGYIEEEDEEEDKEASCSSCRENERVSISKRTKERTGREKGTNGRRFDSIHGTEYRQAERRREEKRERVDRRGTGKRHGVEKRIAGG